MVVVCVLCDCGGCADFVGVYCVTVGGLCTVDCGDVYCGGVLRTVVVFTVVWWVYCVCTV